MYHNNLRCQYKGKLCRKKELYGNSALPAQFLYQPKTALKNNPLIFLKDKNEYYHYYYITCSSGIIIGWVDKRYKYRKPPPTEKYNRS